MSPNDRPSDPTSLVLEIPRNQSPNKLDRAVKSLIEDAWAEQNKNRKSMTDGSAPKLDAVRDMLTVYRDVYLKDTSLFGRDRLRAIEAHYKTRKRREFAKVPMALVLPGHNANIITPMRNLRRNITKTDTIMLNVANGEFPGKY